MVSFLLHHTRVCSWMGACLAYGPVLRMQSDLMVPPTTRDTKKVNGEWQTLQYSNNLLGKLLVCLSATSKTSLKHPLRTLGDRFGQRYRPYTTHEAKTLVKSMVDEVSITWNSELHLTGQQRFRLNPEAKDAYLPFLVTHWIVERHREALLWSWVVARIGGDDDEWGAAQSAQAWMELGGAPDADSVDIRRGARTTLHEEQMTNVLDSTGDSGIGRTQYAFLSRDGYPYVGRVLRRFYRPDAYTMLLPFPSVFTRKVWVENMAFISAFERTSRARDVFGPSRALYYQPFRVSGTS